MPDKNSKVIFDTNVWISFLIGKRLAKIKRYIADGSIIIVVNSQLLDELKAVTARPKLQKYFPKNSVHELIELLETIGHNVVTQPTHAICRDPKDNFLLDLVDFSGADYLVTGDNDLLEHNPFKTAQILTPAEFEKQIS